MRSSLMTIPFAVVEQEVHRMIVERRQRDTVDLEPVLLLLLRRLGTYTETAKARALTMAKARKIRRLCDQAAPDISGDSTSYAPTVEQIVAVIGGILAK